MEKKKLMSVSLLILCFCIGFHVCTCVHPGTSWDNKKQEEPQSLQGASTSGQCPTLPPFNPTSLEERPDRQPMGQIVQIDENQLTHQGNSVEDDQRTLGRDELRGVQESCGLAARLRCDRFFYRPDFVAGIHPLHSLYGAQSHVLSGNVGDGHREVKSKDSSSNRDYGTNNEELNDNSLAAPDQRTAEDASSVVSHGLRSRELEKASPPKRDRMVREERETEREQQGESERVGEIERLEAETRPPRQGGVSAESLWLCEHYQRRCSVQFPCCTRFYPCHRCHNSSANCEEAQASVDATHFKCSLCQFEQEIDENSDVCRGCRKKMAAYFCAICEQFTGVDKNPYHCDQCGICRIYKDKTYHCKVCNVCLNKRLEKNHNCRPDFGHDECPICLEVLSSRPYQLPCSHAVHRECHEALRESGGHTCPVCRHPLPTFSNEPSGRDHRFFPEVRSLLLVLVRLAFMQCG